ncbi:MAG: hypothetical protein CBC25_07030 [Pelagibacteraceae bacterium TMED65]|nr:MAG: hypothetical protein CBC25_07030 [Pelagibacteraceae bacterium TMED65]
MVKRKILLLGKYIKKKTKKKSIYDFLKKKNDVTFFDEYQKIKLKKYDLVIVYGYGKILKKDHIKKLGNNIVNLHIGYLPFARGIYPLVWSLIFFKPIGYSIHLISNEKIDEGPILIKKKINIKKTDNLADIHFNCRKAIENYFFQNFRKIYKHKKKKLNRTKNIKKYYFSKKISKKLISKLPLKWNTKVDYVFKNSKNLKKIYTKNLMKS